MYSYVLIAGAANGLFGFENSVISIAKNAFNQQYPISDAQLGFLESGLPIGATFGALVAGLLQDRLGRRWTLIITCCMYVGAVMISFTSHSFAQLACGRLFTGYAVGLLWQERVNHSCCSFSVGIFSSSVPLYISELSPPSIRGQLVTVNQVSRALRCSVTEALQC